VTSSTPTPPPAAPAAAAPAAPAPASGELGEGGIRALHAEREQRKAAEKTARDEAKRASELEAAAQAGEDAKAEGTKALQQANTLLALNEQGLVGPRAKAAARLLDGVEYGDSNEPTNLSDRIEAAKATYGDELFTGVTSGQPRPETHQGARSGGGTPTEDELFDQYMRQHFPQAPMPAGEAAN
jgi:hypothetical protein